MEGKVPDLSNPLVSHVLIFLTGLVPLIVYLLANQRKKLGYAITRNFEIVTVNKPEMADRITILVDGTPTKELRSTEIILQNIGTKDIQDQAVEIIFSRPAKIINSQAGYDPPGGILKMNIVPENLIDLVIPLMNPGDQIKIHCLTAANHLGACKIIAKGPSFILKRFNPELFQSPMVNGIMALLCILIWAWASVWSAFRVMENPTGQPLWGQALGLILMVVLLAGLGIALYEAGIRTYKRLAESSRLRAI